MKRHLNTLFVTTQGSYLAKQGQAIVVRVEGRIRARVPLHNLEGIVCFGRVGCSPAAMGLCGRCGVAISFLRLNGRFLARVIGPTSGNVLLRREQYRWADDHGRAEALARSVVIGKVGNCRAILQRFAREHPAHSHHEATKDAIRRIEQDLRGLATAEGVDAIRGFEGNFARLYFGVFDHMIRHSKAEFKFDKRSRRPPRDRINALLSFLYTLLRLDVQSALEATGLDPAVGFLHRDRPGRPSLALDLMEELRPVLADRLALSLINRRQVRPEGFQTQESGAVQMGETTRKIVLTAYQKRKSETVQHPFLEESMTLGMVPHIQALLLARHLRGDLDGYPPFVVR